MQRWVFGQKITTSEDIISCDSRKRVLIQRKIANHLFTRLINKWPLCLGLKKLLTTINCCLITSISPFLVKLSSRRIHVCIDFFQEGNQTFFELAHFTNTGNTKITLIPKSTSDFIKASTTASGNRARLEITRYPVRAKTTQSETWKRWWSKSTDLWERES